MVAIPGNTGEQPWNLLWNLLEMLFVINKVTADEIYYWFSRNHLFHLEYYIQFNI